MDTLIIAEKPSVALRLAIALGDNKQKRLSLNGVSYYQIDTSKGIIYIAAAVGHIFTLVQSVRKSGYPVLDVKWAPSYESNPKSEFTKKYLDVLKDLAKKTGAYINACDFDTEGTVIGTNIIKFVTKDGIKSAKRMKFSTTTIPDLKGAYENLMPLDINNFYAGETRHTLDWLWGINLSRALTSAIIGPRTKALSIGRVQGPALGIVAVREKEIAIFKPVPFWKISIIVKDMEFSNTKGDMFDHEAAKTAYESTLSASKSAFVESIDAKETMSRPYPPFDLTSLQLEASRTLRYDPSVTLAMAQGLYERSYISYPRTSSQKLPPTLGLPKIISELAKNPKYTSRANKLIAEKRFKPNEGMKQDEAHPAIYPTGITPSEMNEKEEQLYNLIAERFLSCFAPYAKLARTKVTIKAGDQTYTVDGTKIIEKGWLDFYTYASLGEKELPEFKKGEKVDLKKTDMRESKTAPPKRYSKASLIAELERRDLGTKATRAAIIDTLTRREYIQGSPINVTPFGMSVYEALHENANMILDEETTRKLEKDMEQISEGKKSEQEVIDEGKTMLLDALKLFDSNKSKISEAMGIGRAQAIKPLGKCPKDGGDLVVRRSRVGKQFAACANYPKCTATFSLPQGALIVPTGKMCEFCNTPIVKVIRRGKGAFEMDLDPNCKTKDSWKKKDPEAKVAEATTIKPAPTQPTNPTIAHKEVKATAAADVPATISKTKKVQKKSKAAPSKIVAKSKTKAKKSGKNVSA